MRVKDGRLLLAGGRPRGTLYAVNRFSRNNAACVGGRRTPHRFPHHATLRVKDLNVHFAPAFEYRGPYWSAGF